MKCEKLGSHMILNHCMAIKLCTLETGKCEEAYYEHSYVLCH